MKWHLTIFVLAAGWLSWSIAEAAETNLQFTGIRMLTNKEVALSLGFSNGPTYRISTSTDLLGWPNMLTFPGSGASLSVTDSAAPYLSQRFYRVEPMPTNALTGDHLTTIDGDVVIHPIKHASFLMNWQAKTIYNDPVPVSGFSYSVFPKADLILVGHNHGDHYNASTLTSLTNSNTVIVASRVVYNATSFAPFRSLSILLTNGASTNVIGMNIDAVPAYNFSNNNHPRGDGNGYILTIGGKRIYIAGDTEDTVELKALRNIDVAFIPMILPYTMSDTNAALAVRQIRPAVVYPYHYYATGPGVIPGNVSYFKRQVGQDLGIEVRLRPFDGP